MPCMKGSGKIIGRMEREYFGILKATFTSDNLIRTKQMGLVFTSMSMVQGMKVNGSEMFKKAKVRRCGRMEPGSWARISKA